MKFGAAIESFVSDKWSQGDFRSQATEVSYRAALYRLQDTVSNRDPSYIGASDIRKALAHWQGNSRVTNHAIYRSFFDWCMENGIRKDNPARQVRRARKSPVSVYRLTREEALSMLRAAQGPRERRAIHIGILAGLRSQELRGLQGKHFRRPGFIWVSSDIAKGKRERWVPVLAELLPIAAEIADLEEDDFVLPAQRWRDPGVNTRPRSLRKQPLSKQALYQLVQRVGRRAGIAAPIHPHLLRHAYGDHVARFAGMRNAQFLLGHAGIGTTEAYVGKPTLDELAASIKGFGFGLETERPFYPSLRDALKPVKATTGIEPVQGARRDGKPLDGLSAPLFESFATLGPRIALYVEHFRRQAA